jgi:hypothetical protein
MTKIHLNTAAEYCTVSEVINLNQIAAVQITGATAPGGSKSAQQILLEFSLPTLLVSGVRSGSMTDKGKSPYNSAGTTFFLPPDATNPAVLYHSIPMITPTI